MPDKRPVFTPKSLLVYGLVLAGAWFAFFGVDRMTPKSDTQRAIAATEAELERLALTVQGWDFKRNQYGGVSIVGTVKNNSVKQYGYVQVQFNLYDKSDAQIGSTFANVNNLEPNGTWKFEAVVLQENVASAKVKSVTGF